MSLTLTKQNSKFNTALENSIDKDVLDILEFSKAVISDSGSEWKLFFCTKREMTEEEKEKLACALNGIIPDSVKYEAVITLAPENDENKVFEEQKTDEEELSPMEKYQRRLKELALDAEKKASALPKKEKRSRTAKSISADGIAVFGQDFSPKKVTKISEIDDFTKFVTIEGDVTKKESRTYKDGKGLIFSFNVTDYTSSITCKLFARADQEAELNEKIKGHLLIQGTCSFDDYASETVIKPKNIKKASVAKKTDTAEEKRIELHLHTKMSQMDGVLDTNELVKLMIDYGHDTVAITDHGVVQAFPDIEKAIADNKADIKVIFGVEGYMLDDDPILACDGNIKLSSADYCFFSIRTTGESVLNDAIVEIGACISRNGVLEDKTFHSFINPHREIDSSHFAGTDISNALLISSPDEKEVISAFAEYSKGCIFISHDAGKDVSFIRAAMDRHGISSDFAFVDTLRVSRELITNIKSGKFNKVCEALDIKTGEITDALKKSEIISVLWKRLLGILETFRVFTAEELNAKMNADSGASYHIILFATNKKGLFNLYSLITESHLHHLRRKRPQMPRSLIKKYREGLIIASACEAGELYRALVGGANDETLKNIASFYDYLEIQPLGNNEFMVRDGIVDSKDDLIELNKKIVALGEEMNKPVIATGDVHYLLPKDAIYRSIIQCAEGYSDCDRQAPLYYRTTGEMLDEFYYLPEEKRYEIVVKNPRELANKCEKMESFPRDHLYTPEMENAEEELREMCEKKAHEMYGEVLPEIVEKRLEKELTAIIKHGYAVLYLIAHKVVKKSNSDGYLVGSRGSVGSSFAATMADITEVNPLTPHYLCPKCKYSDFEIDLAQYDCGIDLPEKECPNCGTKMQRLGFNIPFEVFMGFDGDKVPDIDLNFSGVYQPKVHKYIEELFGEKYVFRAGTIGGVAEKTAIGYTKKYCEEYSLPHLRRAETERLAGGCIDVKRTTGQHAGGVVILPKKYNINEFTPLQYPANDPDCGIITTHFTFKSLHDTLLKADILGHDDPTVIRMLEDLTGINVKADVPLDDEKVMSLFLSPDALGISAEELGINTGTFGIPEFGTTFTIKMLEKTKPKTFSDLVKISGLSHGTDVWTNNAENLIDQKIATISQCICTREDIMTTLLYYGCADFTSFDTMEKVRKGKGIPEKYLEEIRAHGIPEWFITSCNLIKYMFPKAHAAAYVTSALRIAWFKVYRPHEYYATYFSVRADDFEVSITKKSIDEIKKMIAEYKAIPHPNPREKGIMVMLQITLEMKLRKIEFADIDLYESDATEFIITEDKMIRPPLSAVPQLGTAAAESIVEARKKEKFKSQDDLRLRTRLSGTLIGALEACGCLKNLPKSQQMSIFDL